MLSRIDAPSTSCEQLHNIYKASVDLRAVVGQQHSVPVPSPCSHWFSPRKSPTCAGRPSGSLTRCMVRQGVLSMRRESALTCARSRTKIRTWRSISKYLTGVGEISEVASRSISHTEPNSRELREDDCNIGKVRPDGVEEPEVVECFTLADEDSVEGVS